MRKILNNLRNKIIFKNKDKIIKILHWKDFCEESENEISLTSYIEKNSIYFRKKILSIFENIEEKNKNFIYHLKIEKEFNFWSLTNFTEKNLYKKNNFFELIKILAVEKISRDLKFDNLIINLHDKEYEKVIYNIINKKKKRIGINIYKSFFICYFGINKFIKRFVFSFSEDYQW